MVNGIESSGEIQKGKGSDRPFSVTRPPSGCTTRLSKSEISIRKLCYKYFIVYANKTYQFVKI